ncbi:PP2C family protein-serine/threonine phosphatase [Rugosimonospora africana]|uniref:Cyclic diguanylate phosphodiesterase n=1 Tax=Rugosimonospora africana TaxID=556532 RepID=A0A8J3VVG7_9ACTN|nr:GAF domain-containing SpoIIE family protein phosphatase [Rugosimonospora africana]GIH19914.1 cyclic diguanylate phosphodiesterase [Rugosimonospora africana]
MTADVGTSGNDERLRRLESVTDAGLSQLNVEDLLVELLERLRELLSVDTAAILLLDPSRRYLIATAARGIEEEVHQGVRLPVGQGFAGQVAALGRPVILERVGPTNVINPLLLDKGIVSLLGVPMIASDGVIGVLHVGTLSPRRFTEDDVDLLQRVADRASLAVQARTASIDRSATVALQRSLLPAELPAVDGLDVAARYVPGARVGIGGDWYDLFALPSGYVGIVIGDVVGNGLRAAVVMGRIRSALRAYALESDDPADVLSRLDRKIQLFEPDAVATVIYAVIEPTRQRMIVSIAGHPPPVLAAPGTAARLLDAPADLPVGAYPDAPRRTVEVPLAAGTVAFFYTDGLVERRDRPLHAGIDKLLDVVTPAPAEGVCAAAMATLIRDQPTSDDVAVLAVRVGQPKTAS